VRTVALAIAVSLVVTAAAAAPAGGWSDDRVIIPAEAARKSWAWLYRSGATAWTPALEDALALEKGLPDYMRRELARQRYPKGKPPLWQRAKTYKRQYVGFRTKERRVAFANFFCDELGTNWRTLTEPFDVDDGGDCYFSVEYDVDKRTFSHLLINADA
jgi:hypothetical protein